MKIERTITLNEEDRKTLEKAAFILNAVNNVCWTPEEIKEFAVNQPASVRDVKIVWE